MKTNRIVIALAISALALPVLGSATTIAPAEGLNATLSAIKAGTVTPQASYVREQKQFAQAQAVVHPKKKVKSV